MFRGESKAGSYLRLIDSCITQLKAQGPSRTCNECKEEVSGSHHRHDRRLVHPWGRLIPENLLLEVAARRNVLAWIDFSAAGELEGLAARDLPSLESS